MKRKQRTSGFHVPARARSLALGALVAAISVAASSASAGATVQANPAATAGSAITWGVGAADTTNLNPFKFEDQGAFLFSAVYDTVTQPGSKGGTVAPDLAASWKQTSPKTWVFHLRHDVRFSNGRSMVADDVVTSFREFIKAGTYAFLFAPATKATAVGKYTVKFHLSTPSASFPAALELLWVLPGRELRNGSFNPAHQTLGTGPYVVKKHTPNVSWTLTANPFYWQKGLPHIKTLNLRMIADESALESALRSGTVDFEAPGSVDAAKALASNNVKVRTISTPDFYWLGMNALTPTESAFKDPRVRQAVNLAIDRQQIISLALGGDAQVTGIPTSTYSDGCVASRMPGFKPNLSKASALMKAAGVSSLTTNLYIAPGTGAVAAPEIAQVVKADLAKIGITVNIVTQEVATWASTVFTKPDFSMAINWFAGGGDASVRPNYWNPNVAGFDKGFLADDPTLDALLTKANGLSAGKQRTAVFQTICHRVATDANMIPLVTKPVVVAYRSDRVVPVFPKVEPWGLPFRYLQDYKLVGQR